MIRVGAFFPEDFDEISPANREQIGDLDALEAVIVPEFSRTAFHVERPIAVAGVVPVLNGVGVGWVLVDESAPRTVSLLRAMRRGLCEVAQQGPFHRIQADVRRSFLQGQKFLRVLGFAHEGPLEAYTSDGTDYERFAFVDRSLIRG